MGWAEHDSLESWLVSPSRKVLNLPFYLQKIRSASLLADFELGLAIDSGTKPKALRTYLPWELLRERLATGTGGAPRSS